MTQEQQHDKSGRAATLIPYARSILQAMKENGYLGTVWDDVLNEYEKATAPLPETGTSELPMKLRSLAAKAKYRHSEADEAMVEAAARIEQLERVHATETGDTPRTDAQPKAQYRDAVFQELVAADFARQLEREVIAWQRQAKAMARAADNEKRRADAAPLSASGHPFDFRGYTTTNTSAAEPVSTTQERKA